MLQKNQLTVKLVALLGAFFTVVDAAGRSGISDSMMDGGAVSGGDRLSSVLLLLVSVAVCGWILLRWKGGKIDGGALFIFLFFVLMGWVAIRAW